FQPHVTLARVGAREVHVDSRVLEPSVPTCRFTVREFTCFESVLGPVKSRHRVLQKFALER
ncbi:MAG TPA: hypothetical protein VM509_07670, partial [Planctomycetota bacterium]|nr:hypothetical protein [Planctomycetota bacterium]